MRRLALPFSLALFILAGTPGTLEAQPKAPVSGPLASGLAALAASDYATAESDLAQVKGGGEADAKLGLARAALEQGKYADADKYAQAAAGSSAAHKVQAATLRAEILAHTGKKQDAIKLLDSVKAGKGADVRRARLLLGEYLIDVGRRGDADDPLHKVIEEYNDGTITTQDAEGNAHVGRAAFLLRSPKDANTAFKESERADKKRVETLLWAAELFLDKYDPGHAEEDIKDALAARARPRRRDRRARAREARSEPRLRRGRKARQESPRGEPEAHRRARRARGHRAARHGHRDRREGDRRRPRHRPERPRAAQPEAPPPASSTTIRAASRPRRRRCSLATRSTRASTASSASTRSGSTATTTSSR